MWGMITALVSGALMSIQGVFNSAVMKQTSMWVSAGWVQISAFVVCLLMWLFTGRGAVSELWQIEPRYMLTGGVIGADPGGLPDRGVWLVRCGESGI